MEGLSYESVALAGHWRLSKLSVLFDDNQVTIDGPTDLSTSENILQRFQACHWSTRTIDGHSFKEIEDALHWAQKQDRPCFIACRTIIGYGCLSKQGRSACHGSPLGADEVAKARTALNWTEAYPFVIPENIKKWALMVWSLPWTALVPVPRDQNCIGTLDLILSILPIRLCAVCLRVRTRNEKNQVPAFLLSPSLTADHVRFLSILYF
jgi:hypothetical protein